MCLELAITSPELESLLRSAFVGLDEFPGLVFRLERLGPIYIHLLSALGAAAEQDNERFAVLREVNSVARPLSGQ